MNTVRTIWAACIAMATALLLLGCASSPSTSEGHAPRSFGAHNAAHSAAVTVPQAARDALAQLGTVVPSAAGHTHHASTALPHTFNANQQYAGSGGSGWVSMSADVAVSPTELTMQPAGTSYPGNFSYIIYRVDDIAQAITTLDITLGSHPPTALGIAAYNWAYGSRGRWEPLYYDSPISSPSPLALDQPGANYISADGDLAFALFCINPASFAVQSITVNADVSNPNYDELEQNDTIEIANPLPPFPLAGLRGNVGIGGQYDGDAEDYFSFTGSPGEMYRFTITPVTPSPDFFSAYAYDNTGRLVGEYVTDPLGFVTLTVLVTTNQVQPLVLDVYDDGFATDYTIDGVRVFSYGEVEDNDSQVEATPQPAPVFIVNGNLGPNGNDGDMDDWFSFTAQFDEKPLLVMWYDMATMSFDFVNAPPVVTDANGVPVCTGVDASQSDPFAEAVLFSFPNKITSEQMPLSVEFSPVSGKSNYWFERFPR